jgi:hypothetical protein
MALRSDRHEAITDISFFMDATGTRGRIVKYDVTSSGTGASMDDADAKVTPVLAAGEAHGTGVIVAGLLLNDVVNKDLSQTHLNRHLDEVQVGSKVRLLKRGWVVTDVIHANSWPNPGAAAYFTLDGVLTTDSDNGVTQVGRFAGLADSDGFAKVFIDIY